jgi:enoyl-CoA hydratase
MATQSASTVTVHRDDDGSTVTLTLRRAQCLDIAGKQELTDVFSALADDADARVVILRSEHPAALLVDVAELAHMTPAAALSYSRAGQRLMETLEALPVPIIAAVSGPALGGGCELVLGCDLAFCTGDATFGQIEANGGVVPAFGGTWRLVRRVGYQRACQMIFTAAVLDAPAAKEYGLVLDVLAASELLDRCQEMATDICGASRASVAEAKHILTRSSGREPAMANAMEQAGFAAMFGAADQRERMDAFLAANNG